MNCSVQPSQLDSPDHHAGTVAQQLALVCLSVVRKAMKHLFKGLCILYRVLPFPIVQFASGCIFLHA